MSKRREFISSFFHLKTALTRGKTILDTSIAKESSKGKTRFVKLIFFN
jgi:hypothetical protein